MAYTESFDSVGIIWLSTIALAVVLSHSSEDSCDVLSWRANFEVGTDGSN